MSEKKVPNTGFTLIEMLMVIGIFGILLGIAVPVFKDIGQGSKLDAASRELRGVLLLARQHAITKRETVYVVFP
ncbi:MAG: prepilin-type N-terminal cleavage/methylation domain-containing protein, partial [Kiritimatiellia bacterium]|nr:prepilin-type N-terminal cleavage/methylation domain-containing protein [Kiritimatiellia bacterium]